MAINTHYSQGIGGSGGADIIVIEPETNEELETPVDGDTPETPKEDEG